MEIISLTTLATFIVTSVIIELTPGPNMAYLAILPTFITSLSSAASQAITLTIVYVLVATLIHGTIVISAASARTFLENDRQRLLVRRVLSLALAGVALWFAWTTQRGF